MILISQGCQKLRKTVGYTLASLMFFAYGSLVQAADTVKIGHVAALSGPSAQSGEAITRGLTIAIDEINAAGGILGGRQIDLVQRDDESKPPRGLVAARELIFKEKVVAFFGGIEKFENNDVDMVPQLTRLKEAGADVIILVVNAPPGAQMMKSRERMGWDAPVVSHWGISGGRFPELAGPTAGDAHFVQTYSFHGAQGPAGQRMIEA